MAFRRTSSSTRSSSFSRSSSFTRGSGAFADCWNEIDACTMWWTGTDRQTASAAPAMQSNAAKTGSSTGTRRLSARPSGSTPSGSARSLSAASPAESAGELGISGATRGARRRLSRPAVTGRSAGAANSGAAADTFNSADPSFTTSPSFNTCCRTRRPFTSVAAKPSGAPAIGKPGGDTRSRTISPRSPLTIAACTAATPSPPTTWSQNSADPSSVTRSRNATAPELARSSSLA